MAIKMDIEEVFTLKIQKILNDNDLKLQDLANAIEDTDKTGDGPALRTLKGYASNSTHSKKNAGLRSLQAIALGCKKLGINIDESGLIARNERSLTGDDLIEAVKFLAISKQEITENELSIFMEVFQKIGAGNMLEAANLIGSEQDHTVGYLKLAKLAAQNK
jgi:hypothetical protein